jgi:DNA repair protein RecO (recombination protein O)
MEWQDEGIVIGVRRLGEGDVILEAMTRAHGRHLGVVKGGRSRRMQPSLQAGNGCELVWRARIDEQLGQFAVEPTRLRAASLMGSSAALYAIATLGALLRLLPERDPHPALYETLVIVLNALDQPSLAAPLMVRFELALLGELGFGLDLLECAATGSADDLIYVSPKSGRAVSAGAGEPYKDRLLALPSFLKQGEIGFPDAIAVAQGLALTGYFLERHLFGPRGVPVPEARSAFVALFPADKHP